MTIFRIGTLFGGWKFMVPKHGNLVKVHLHRASLLMINSFNDDEIIRLSVNTYNSQFHWFL
jgi:hypothetical protein